MKTIQRRKKSERFSLKDGRCLRQEQSDSERVDSKRKDAADGFGELFAGESFLWEIKHKSLILAQDERWRRA